MKSFNLLVCIFLALAGLSCSTSQIVKLDEGDLSQSLIELTYVLGHNQYLLRLASENGSHEISNFMNDTRLEFRNLTADEFLNFSERVRRTARSYNDKQQSVLQACKAPFSILIRSQSRQSITQGCRDEDENGEFGRLIREAEILFYSQKSPS